MPYLVDTDWVIDHLSAVPDAIQLLEVLSQDGIAISIITYMEVYQGIVRIHARQNVLADLDFFLEGVPVLPFSLEVARRCAHLREFLKQRGKRVNARAHVL